MSSHLYLEMHPGSKDVLCISQNKLNKLLYDGQLESYCKGGAVHGFEAQNIDHPRGFYALEPLVTHCVQKTKCVNAHTMTNKAKLC